ncbi:nucleoside hydrolase [Dehalobacter sp. DCM]|uniref:nucleoside hydrolase n=1 Tax=Dehalobacter sp. DCM TaxID=2907827 RepID=UPI0030820A97|nr:nucleoside hydrolase [Dehalobacter sp. DCM]
MHKKIIFDCDNTMGVQGADVDDGLALIYLLGKMDAEICGITTTYGNSDVETVYTNTQRMLHEIGRSDIPFFKGCPDNHTHISDAVDFLVKTVDADPGSISILATGSLTNIYAAFLKDPLFFQKTAEIVVMGGITEPLIINERNLDELNFSCDLEAVKVLMENGRNISIITGNNCLKAFFSREEFIGKLNCPSPSTHYLRDNCMYWFTHIMKIFETDGFYNWDVVAAVYLMDRSLFTDCFKMLKTNLEDLKQGFLLFDDTKDSQHSGLPFINLPVITDSRDFIEEVYTTWLSFHIK